MVTLKIVLIGIMTLVPERPWHHDDGPGRVHVLFNSGSQGTEPHHALLFFEPKNLKTKPSLPTSFRYAARDCAKLPDLAYTPLREAWAFHGLELTVEAGAPADSLQAVLCDRFEARSADPTAECRPDDPNDSRRLGQDVRWLLDIEELAGTQLTLDESCLEMPVGKSCAENLAARMILDAGLISTQSLSGGTSQGLRWVLADLDDALTAGAPEVTFAGSLEVEVQIPAPGHVSIRRRALSGASDAAPSTTLELSPAEGEDTIVLVVENVPLSDRLPLKPCNPEEPVPEALHHAMLHYAFAAGTTTLTDHRIPRRPPGSTGTMGAYPENPPKCEPPLSFAYPGT